MPGPVCIHITHIIIIHIIIHIMPGPVCIHTCSTPHTLGPAIACEQVMQTSGGAEVLGEEPALALATNNTFADSGRVDGLPAHKKSVAGAARKLEALLSYAFRVRVWKGGCLVL